MSMKQLPFRNFLWPAKSGLSFIPLSIHVFLTVCLYFFQFQSVYLTLNAFFILHLSVPVLFLSVRQVECLPSCVSDPVFLSQSQQQQAVYVCACVCVCVFVCVWVSRFPDSMTKREWPFQRASLRHFLPVSFISFSGPLLQTDPLFPPPGNTQTHKEFDTPHKQALKIHFTDMLLLLKTYKSKHILHATFNARYWDAV